MSCLVAMIVRLESLFSTFRIAVAMLLCCALPVAAETEFDFDGPETSWRIARGNHRLHEHHRVSTGSEQQQTFESLLVSARPGYSILVEHAIDDLPVIEETIANVRLRSNQPGVQVALRVQFPRSKHFKTGKTLSTIIVGPRYSQVGQWQTITIDRVPLLSERNARVLRTQPEQEVDTREAFVSHVVLLVPGGPQPARVDIDSMQVEGEIDRSAESEDESLAQGVGTQQALEERTPVDVQMGGGRLFVNSKPLFPRLVEYQGEPLELLAKLGFNGIVIQQPPTDELMIRADALGMWVVGPPPSETTEAPEANTAWRMILAWDCGRRLDVGSLDSVTSLCDSIHSHADRNLHRPTSASLLRHHGEFAGLVDLVRVPLPSLLGLRSPLTVRDEIANAKRQSPPGSVVLAEIPLDLPAAARQQIEAFDGPTVKWIEPRTVRHQAWHAIASGSSGLVFQTGGSLLGRDPSTTRMRAYLKLLNDELRLAEPWLSHGQAAIDVEDANRETTLYIYPYDRTRLCVMASQVPWASGDGVSQRNHEFVVPNLPVTANAYRVEGGTLQPLRLDRQAGGARLSIARSNSQEMLLLTDDARATANFRNRLQQVAMAQATSCRDAARSDLAALQQLFRALPGHDRPVAVNELLPLAGGLMSRCELALSGRRADEVTRLSAEVNLRVEQADALVRRRVVVESPLTSIPTSSTTEAWATHAKLHDVLQQCRPDQNVLPGGNFEQLAQIQAVGWTHHQRPDKGHASTVSLTSVQPKVGGHALRISSTASAASLGSGPAVWIESPAISIAQGDLLEVTGWLRVTPQDGRDTQLRVYDSLGGPELALEARTTESWQHFRIIRKAVEADSLKLVFTLAGSGDADIDGVMLRRLALPVAQGNTARTNKRSAATR